MGSVVDSLFGGAEPTPPDYAPMAAASAEAARLGAELGREQLAQNKAQYDESMQIARPIIEKQSALMDQQIQQGNDYYDYAKGARPIEDQLRAEAAAAGGTAEQEAAAGRAAADVRQGTTAAQNQLLRQGLRYGFSPAKMAAAGIGAANGQGLAMATAANQAREQTKAAGFAKKMDVTGLARGMTGVSQGAYSLANNSGNSAVANKTGTASQFLQGLDAGNRTIMSGQGMQLGGLGNILNTQAGMYQADQQRAGQEAAGLGQAVGTGAMLFAMKSDRRLKENISRVGTDPRGFGIYEFNYIGAPERWRGVMADEIEAVMPAAVVRDELGYASVDYGMLGLEMVEV